MLLKHKQLMQRPVVVTKDKAIIGRPKDRVRQLLAAAPSDRSAAPDAAVAAADRLQHQQQQDRPEGGDEQ